MTSTFALELWWWCEAEAASHSVCLFLAGWGGGGGGGGGGRGVMMNETSCTSNGDRDQCHPIVLLWQSGRIAVSLPAQWQTRLSWEWREALFCHAKSLKPSSFRLGNPQYCVTASAAERWQSQSQRTHGPGSLELRRATAPRRGEARHLFLILCEKDPKPGIKGVFLSSPRCLTQSERGHLLNVIMIIFSSRSVLLSVYYPQIFLILTSGSYL